MRIILVLAVLAELLAGAPVIAQVSSLPGSGPLPFNVTTHGGGGGCGTIALTGCVNPMLAGAP